jgi:tRNA modification GTPase
MIADTIVAPATPHGTGGISVIRVSGPGSLEFIRKQARSPGGSILQLKHRLSTLSDMLDEDLHVFDRVMVTYYKAPNSYTGEEMVEISAHGNPVIVQKILSVGARAGLRLADPGEFTRRAFLNGKMDLLQAEAVANTIHSHSIESSNLNYKIMSGTLSKRLLTIRTTLIDVLSKVEFELDVSEESLQEGLKVELESSLSSILTSTERLLSSFHYGNLLTRGAVVVIAGPPNVGKSTLLNSLSYSDRAITHDIPGTTRDPIDLSLFIEGVPITLVDTAGLRKTEEAVELKGIHRTREFIEKADIVIALGSVDLAINKRDYNDINCPVIYAVNKSDLLNNRPDETANIEGGALLISALDGSGLDELRTLIKDKLGVSSGLKDSIALTTNRQKSAIQTCHTRAEKAIDLIGGSELLYELVAFELREGLNALDVLLGKTTPEDILNNIFNNFCVGK